MRTLYFGAGIVAIASFGLAAAIGTFSAIDGEMSSSQTWLVIGLLVGASLAGVLAAWAARKGAARWP